MFKNRINRYLVKAVTRRVVHFVLSMLPQFTQQSVVATVCPPYNAPRYNAESGITRSTVAPEN